MHTDMCAAVEINLIIDISGCRMLTAIPHVSAAFYSVNIYGAFAGIS